MPCARGVEPGTLVEIGPEAAWLSLDPGFQSWYMEFSGTGLGFIESQMAKDEQLMAILGSKLLESQKRAAETAEAQMMRQMGEESVVMSAALSVSKAIEKSLWYMAYWMGEDNAEVSVSMTSALTDLQLSDADLRLIFEALQAGRLSEQTWYEALIRRTIIRGREWEEEQALARLNSEPRMGDAVDLGPETEKDAA
jgi:hypothetical protein